MCPVTGGGEGSSSASASSSGARRVFQLATKESVKHKLSHFLSDDGYAGSFDTLLRDHDLIKGTVSQLLEVEADYPTYPECGFKFAAHVNKIDGYVSATHTAEDTKEISFSSKLNVTLFPVRKTYKKNGKVEGVDFKRLMGWHQQEFLLMFLYIVLNQYGDIYRDKLALPQINKILLLDACFNEIWVVVNAYRIRITYAQLSQATNNSKEALSIFASELQQSLCAVMKEAEVGDEISIPCGFLEHAMYLTCERLVNDRILLRVDNLGPGYVHNMDPANGDNGAPFVVYVAKLCDCESDLGLREYLTEVLRAKKVSGTDATLPIIYADENENFKRDRSGVKTTYTFLPSQKKENCTAENYLIGVRNRLYELGGSKEHDVYNWFCGVMVGGAMRTAVENPADSETDKIRQRKRERETRLLRAPISTAAVAYEMRKMDVEFIIKTNSNIGADNIYFTGRESIIRELGDHLHRTSSCVISQVIVGLGGMGKTEVALEYARRNRDDYRGLCWVFDARSQDSLLASFRKFLINFYDDEAQLLPLGDAALIAKVHKILSLTQVLIIFDGAQGENPEIYVTPFLPKNSHHHVIITSNSGAWRDIERIPLGLFDEKDATTYILNVLNQHYHRDVRPEEASALATGLGFYPLALFYAVHTIKGYESGWVSIKEYLVEFTQDKEVRHDLYECPELAGDSHKSNIYTTWSLIKTRLLKSENVIALQILQLCAYLNTKNIPEDIFKQCASTKAKLKKALTALGDNFIIVIEINNNWGKLLFQLHAIMQDVIRFDNEKNPEEPFKYLFQAVELLSQLFIYDTTERAHTLESGMLYAKHVESLLDHLCELSLYTPGLKEKTDTILEMGVRLCKYCTHELDDERCVIKIGEKLLRFSPLVLSDDPRLGAIYLQLANAHINLFETEKAGECLAYYRRYHDPNASGEYQLVEANLLANDKSIRWDAKSEAVLEMYENAVRLFVDARDTANETTGIYLRGFALNRATRLEEAETVLLQAIERKERFWGLHHLYLTAVYDECAKNYIECGVDERRSLDNDAIREYFKKAIFYATKSLRIRLDLAPNHVKVGYPYYLLGQVYSLSGLRDEAIKNLQAAQAIAREHQDAMIININRALITIYWRCHRSPETIPLIKEILEVLERPSFDCVKKEELKAEVTSWLATAERNTEMAASASMVGISDALLSPRRSPSPPPSSSLALEGTHVVVEEVPTQSASSSLQPN